MVTRVSEALGTGTVIVRPEWRNFEQTVSGLVDRLLASGRLPAALGPLAVERIREREAMASTAMVDIGVSIPHARLEGIGGGTGGGIGGILAAMAVAPSAVYEVGDGLPISIVVLALSSPAMAGTHLNFLSTVSILLQSARFRERVRSALTADEVLTLIRTSE